MASQLFRRLRQRDPEDLSPQLRSNLDTMAGRVRFREFRRTQGRPGITNMGFFPTGGTAPIPSQIAAGRISSQLGTGFGSELNRLTAPDPMTFALGERAPALADIDVRTRGAGATSAEQLAEQERIRTGFLDPQLQQGLDVGQQQLTEAEAEAERRQQRFPSELEVLEQAPRVGELGIQETEQRLAGAPTTEEIVQDRQTARELLGRQAGQELNQQRLDTMQEDIASLEAQGDLEGAARIRRQRDALLGGDAAVAPGGAPAAPTGAPQPSTGITNPVRVQINTERADSVMEAFGLNEELKKMEELSKDVGFPEADTPEKLDSLLRTIQSTLNAASDEGPRPTPQDIIRSKIKAADGYISLKKRAGIGDVIGRNIRGTLGTAAAPLLGVGRIAAGSARPQALLGTRETAQQIVDLVEG